MAVKNQRVLIKDETNNIVYMDCQNDDVISVEGQMSVSLGGDLLSIDTLTPEVQFKVRLPEILRPIDERKINIPSPYKKVEYVELKANQLIDTGIYGYPNSKIEIDYQFSHPFEGYQLGILKTKPRSGDNPDSPYTTFVVTSYGTGLDDMGGFKDLASGPSLMDMRPYGFYVNANRHNLSIDLNERKFTFDETTVTATGGTKYTTPTSNTLTLFDNSYYNRIYPDIFEDLRSRLYSFKASRDGTTTNEFVPVINEDGQAGLYDIVTDTFITSSGSDKWISGSITEAIYDGIMDSNDKILVGHYTTETPPEDIPYGTSILYYNDDNLVGRFYLDTIERTARNFYRINAMSLIGIFDRQDSYGGVFQAVPFSDVVDTILNPILVAPYQKAINGRIYGAGNAWINTSSYTTWFSEDGIRDDISIKFKLYSVPSSTVWLFGNDSFRIGVKNGNIVSWQNTSNEWQTSENTTNYPWTIDTNDHVLRLNGTSIYMDDVYVGVGGPYIFSESTKAYRINESELPLFVFAADDSGMGINSVNGYLYSFDFIKKGKDERKMTAYVRTSGGVGAMYDSVSGSFAASPSGHDFSGTVSAPIIPSNPYGIEYEQGIDDILVYGWLPCASKRSNLHQLLFAYNVNLIKKPEGGLLFTYVSPNVSKSVIGDKIYAEGSCEYLRRIDNAKVTEHSFYILQTTESEVLYDNTTELDEADYTQIIFSSAPIRVDTLQTTGTIVIHQSNENYAIISGRGQVIGTPYEHSERIISKKKLNGDDIISQNVAEVSDCTLITAMNSQNVLDRLWNYRNSTEKVNSEFEYSGEKCGQYISLYNPYGEVVEAFIQKMSLNASAKIKINSELLVNYIPITNNNTFKDFVILTGSGTWQKPSGVSRIRAILISGGSSGDYGYNGDNGQTSSWSGGSPTEGGEGGDGGDPGLGGRIRIVDIENAENSYSYSCGQGSHEHTSGPTSHSVNLKGKEGADTTFGSYTTKGAVSILEGIMNIFTGEAYAIPGKYGVKGGQGGLRIIGDVPSGSPAPTDIPYSMDGEDVVFEGSISRGGKGKIGVSVEFNTSGGGAAVGADGYDGGTPTGYNQGPGGPGGNGASPSRAGADGSIYGQGGSGGHGGGGGGNAGTGESEGTPGTGGIGGPGGFGADGAILIYY